MQGLVHQLRRALQVAGDALEEADFPLAESLPDLRAVKAR
jgi:hypothetical protein